MSQIKTIAVIGTGVIGAGWIIRCLAHNKIIHAYDKDIKLKKNLLAEIKRHHQEKRGNRSINIR